MRRSRLHDTDRAWRDYGRSDPYYGVLSDARYHADVIDERARAEFFASGEQDIERTFAWIRHVLDPAFAPRRAVDFGCGLGRLALPLAKRVGHVTGVDISPDMLEEARKNCARAGVVNAEFVLSDDALSRLSGEYDFVHSFIVFQHIPPARGEAMLTRLLDHLADGGIGALHFTFGSRLSGTRRLVQLLRKRVPMANNLVNVAKGRGFWYPPMQMNSYDLNRLYMILLVHGCHEVSPRFTDHGRHIGAMLFFRKQTLPVW
jgi:SAM-dependent methyltransferase